MVEDFFPYTFHIADLHIITFDLQTHYDFAPRYNHIVRLTVDMPINHEVEDIHLGKEYV